jgi:hypothetical protein
VAVRSRDGPQRLAQIYRRLLTTPRRDAAGSDATETSAEPPTRS